MRIRLAELATIICSILNLFFHADAALAKEPYEPPILKEEIAVMAPKGVKCMSYSPRISSGNIVKHGNDTFHVKLATEIEIDLEEGHVSCIQVEIEDQSNDTAIQSVFYTFSYGSYQQQYSVRETFDFGIPEFRSECKCDCPKSDEFCTYNFGNKYCKGGTACVQKYYANMASSGCQHTGPADVCCSISVRPFLNKRYTAIRLSPPTSTAELSIGVYVRFNGKWALARRYTERITFTRNSYLHLNGDDKWATNIEIKTKGGRADFQLPTWDKYFVFEPDRHPFKLMAHPTQQFSAQAPRYNFLQFSRGRWHVHNALIEIAEAHSLQMTNCKEQLYTDRYRLPTMSFVIRNSTGALNWQPREGIDLKDSYKTHIADISLTDDGTQSVILNVRSPPSLDVSIKLEQKLSIVSHLHASYVDGFVGRIRLDKHRNRFLNVTLVNAFGKFTLRLFRDISSSEPDLSLSVVASIPVSMNYSEIIALPSFISENRYACLYPDHLKSKQKCQWVLFDTEPVQWYELPAAFIQTESNCPGCNEYEREGFLSFLNPRNWFKGIDSISEGVAVGLEVIMYVVILVVAIAVFRRCIWPVLRWALCASAPNMVSGPHRKKKISDDEIIQHL